jgi:hypothetical protein
MERQNFKTFETKISKNESEILASEKFPSPSEYIERLKEL